LTAAAGVLTFGSSRVLRDKERRRLVEIAHKVNILLVCAAFVFVGALVIGIVP
jgi:hypothetical protein